MGENGRNRGTGDVGNRGLTTFPTFPSYSNHEHHPQKAGNEVNFAVYHIELFRSFPYVGSLVKGRRGVRQLVHTPILGIGLL